MTGCMGRGFPEHYVGSKPNVSSKGARLRAEAVLESVVWTGGRTEAETVVELVPRTGGETEA